MEEVLIKDVIHEVAQMILPRIKEKKRHFEINCADFYIKTDKYRILRILLNLLTNAVKFTQTGGIKINAYSAINNFIIEVEDTGIGIPEDQLDKMFEEFYKIKPSNQSAEFHSCGLGLYLVRSMINEIGGKIRVESKVGSGSKFTVILKQEN